MTVLLFLFILGVLLFLLARETVILIGLLLQLAGQLLLIMWVILRWTTLTGIRLGLWWKRRAHIRKMGMKAVEMEFARRSRQRRTVQLVDRGDGVYVPKGGW